MKKIEKDKIIINYSDSLEQLATNSIELLNEKNNEYCDLFSVNKKDIITANYFDDLNDFREFIYNIRGEKESLPGYAKGTYDNGMINIYVDNTKQMEQLYTTSHELFHILYMKHILKNNYDNRIVWYDEGMAQFFSGENIKLDEEKKFKTFYINVRKKTKIIPNMNEIDHGESFCNNDYNGYDLSFLAIKYLFETMPFESFKKMMSNFDEIKLIGKNIIDDVFNYYDNKYIN